MPEQENSIFLNDRTILRWNIPTQDSATHQMDGITVIKKSLSPDSPDFFSEKYGPYKIVASAAKYLADIARTGPRLYLEPGEEMANPMEEQVLLEGGIEVYEHGKTHGTEAEGYHLERRGKIWMAIKPTPQTMGTNSSILHALLDYPESNLTDEWCTARIEAILRGYEEQEREARRFREEMLGDSGG